jgi:hypothetical protein
MEHATKPQASETATHHPSKPKQASQPAISTTKPKQARKPCTTPLSQASETTHHTTKPKQARKPYTTPLSPSKRGNHTPHHQAQASEETHGMPRASNSTMMHTNKAAARLHAASVRVQVIACAPRRALRFRSKAGLELVPNRDATRYSWIGTDSQPRRCGLWES